MAHASRIQPLDEKDPEPEADPEAAVAPEYGGAEDIFVAEFPHGGQQLDDAAVGEGVPQPGSSCRFGHPARVGGGQQKGGEGEGSQAERGRIGDGRHCRGRRGRWFRAGDAIVVDAHG
jgi:hypothetical protein